MWIKGKITTWNDEKGFGFITPSTGGKRVFVHISSFSNRNWRPTENQSVTYILSADSKGRPRAIHALLEGDRVDKKYSPQSTEKPYKVILAIICSTCFLTIVALTVISGKTSPFILFFYIFISLFTFVIYAMDKSAAREKKWRTSEKTLHTLSMFGGWPGALIAQQKLNHKSRKQPFQLIFWATVLLNCCIFVYLLQPKKAISIQKVFTQLSQNTKSTKLTKTHRPKYGKISIYNSKGEKVRTIELEN